MARRWCLDEFGKIPVIYREITGINKKTGKKYNKYIGLTYDDKEARWLQRSESKNNPKAFYFKDIIDAMAFKLRWI